jgi:hypothetical protein
MKRLSQRGRRVDEEARNNANNEKLLNARASKPHLRLVALLSVLLVLGVFLHNAADVGIYVGIHLGGSLNNRRGHLRGPRDS